MSVIKQGNYLMTASAPRFDPAVLAASMAALGQTASGSLASAAPTPKEKASIYLAFAQLRDGADTSNPDPVKDFITLPQMTGLDNMNPDTRRAGTQEFANEQAERNEFLQDLIEQSLSTLAPGETRLIPLYVTIYRKKDEVVAAPVEARKREKISFFAA
jgi:hypothetical protein